ncbi:MAG: diaminopimelate decarboxylase [Desulfobacterales bacterium]|nr:diaminopimelate decarboxylase [Desulfobacterales bacterium]
MPMSATFENRLLPILDEICDYYGTPFHIYDEAGIRETGQNFIRAFSRLNGFREYYAVKALPNPRILQIMQDLGFGFDCSSVSELVLSRQIGARGEDIMFSSNNTTAAEFEVADADGGCILNLDDISLIGKVPQMPETISFRYNPGPSRSGNSIIGDPMESKYGVADTQIIEAYQAAKARGARRFGLHTMLVSNELDAAYMVQTAAMLLDVAARVSKALDIRIEFVNIGGGLGIPYKPGQKPLDIEAMAAEITGLFSDYKAQNGYEPQFYIESGRYMTGSHGVLVTTAINQKDIYRKYIGVDACMSALMRPAIYGAYHHISVIGKHPKDNFEKVDVVGSLCENNDKFAIQRLLPEIQDGDRLLIHDTGAHGHSMGFNYNGRLRPKEVLLRRDGSVELIRREETIADLFTTLNFAPQVLQPSDSSGDALENLRAAS